MNTFMRMLVCVVALWVAMPTSGAAQEQEPRFDVSVDSAPARAFFMGLVDGTPHNMLVHPDVNGRVTLQRPLRGGGAISSWTRGGRPWEYWFE